MTEKRIVCITDVCSSIFAGGDAPKKHFSFCCDRHVLQSAPFTNMGSVVEVFSDLTLWVKIKSTIAKVNQNTAAYNKGDCRKNLQSPLFVYYGKLK